MSKPTIHRGRSKAINQETPEQREARWAIHHLALAARRSHAIKAGGRGSARSWEARAQMKIKSGWRKDASA